VFRDKSGYIHTKNAPGRVTRISASCSGRSPFPVVLNDYKSDICNCSPTSRLAAWWICPQISTEAPSREECEASQLSSARHLSLPWRHLGTRYAANEEGSVPHSTGRHDSMLSMSSGSSSSSQCELYCGIRHQPEIQINNRDNKNTWEQ